MPKKVAVGVVTSDKMAKTRRVEIARKVKHPKYGKIIRKKTVCYVHDEHDQSHTGDMVEIVESRPLSKLKRWNLVRVVEKSRAVDVAALRAAHQQAEREAAESGQVTESQTEASQTEDPQTEDPQTEEGQAGDG